MIFVLAARHRDTDEVAAWIIERESLWHAMKNRSDIEAPPTLSVEWIARCDIALMEPGTVYTGDVWEQIQEAERRDLKQTEELCEGELEAMVDETFESGDGETISRELLEEDLDDDDG